MNPIRQFISELEPLDLSFLKDDPDKAVGFFCLIAFGMTIAFAGWW